MGAEQPTNMQEKILLQNPTISNVTNGGPRFKKDIFKKIEKAKNNGWGAQLKNWINTNRQISFITLTLVTLVLGGFMISQANITSDETANLGTLGGITLQENLEVNLVPLTQTGGMQPIVLGTTTNTMTVAAAVGNGITHLARTAVNEYLQTNGLALSAEQMVYAEDYLQNLTGDYALSMGEKINFSNSDIQTAINAAQGLADWQIENLSKYVN